MVTIYVNMSNFISQHEIWIIWYVVHWKRFLKIMRSLTALYFRYAMSHIWKMARQKSAILRIVF